MRAIAINGSPRQGWNTESVLRSALDGAASAGAETELIDLYRLDYTGCMSCFGCKQKNISEYRCYVKDELTHVLDKVMDADAVFLGSPIYFGDISGQMMCFLERLAFPLLSYDDYQRKLFPGHVNAAFFFTMNAPRTYYENEMRQSLQSKVNLLKRLGGTVESYACCDTLQFSDYSRHSAAAFDETHKKQLHEEQFPKDLAAAYDIGRRLIIK